MNFQLIQKNFDVLKNVDDSKVLYAGVMDVILLLLNGAEKISTEAASVENTIKQLLVAGKLRSQLADLADAKENIKAAINDTKKAFKDTEKQIKALEKANSELLSEKENLLNTEKELEQKRDEVYRLKEIKEERLDELNTEIQNLNEDINNVENEIANKNAEVESFFENLNNLRSELSSLSDFLVAAQKEIFENERIIEAFPSKCGIASVDEMLVDIKSRHEEVETQKALDAERICKVIEEIEAIESKLTEEN